ncbi:hypothetical protein [Bradyrhizobium elkanii]
MNKITVCLALAGAALSSPLQAQTSIDMARITCSQYLAMSRAILPCFLPG